MKTIALLLSVGAALGAFAESAKPIVDLDFTKGCPPGCTVRRGTQFSSEGCFSTNPIPCNVASGVVMTNAVAYPRAFTFEAEFVIPRQRTSRPREMFLWDETGALGGPHAPPHGVTMTFYRCNSTWRPELYLGFGTNTVKVVGPHMTHFKTGDHAKFRFTYDGFGNVYWNFAGLERVTKLKVTGPIASSGKKPCVGDRIKWAYAPFEGILSRVRIIPEEVIPIAIRRATPTAFIRGEPDDDVSIEVSALGDETLEGVSVAMEQRAADGFRAGGQSKSLGRIRPENPAVVTFPVETRLTPGKQNFEVTVSCRTADGRTVRKTVTIPGLIGPRMRPHMPVVAWLGGHPSELNELGFTHTSVDGGIGSTNGSPDMTWHDLDRAVAGGVRMYLNQGELWVPGVPRKDQARWRGNGKPWMHALEVSNPVVQDYSRKVAKVAAERIGLHPGLGAVLICSESRGTSNPSYNTEVPNYYKAGGEKPPKPKKHPLWDLVAKYKDRGGLLDEQDPTYRFWYWWRSKGDGWADYISIWADAFAKVHGKYEDGSALQRKRPFFSFHDPVVRWASVWGVPGTADIASNWIYAAPDPMAVAGPIEQLFARAEANPGQQVMIMTQLICYRTQLAPWKVKVDHEPEWVKRLPRATYPSIPSDVLQEATWTMIAKPVRGIMYHGWGCIHDTGEKNGYCYTCPESRLMISNLLHNVVTPLGPTLLALGRRSPRVAVIESSTTSCLGQGYGNGWAAPHVTRLQRARLDPRVINEEGVVRDGLDGVKVAYIPQCRLVTKAFADRLAEFQKRGGILVGDDDTAKVLKPDLLMPKVTFLPELEEDTAQAAERQDRLLNPEDTPRHKKTVEAHRMAMARAEAIRTALAEKGYVSPVGSTSPEIVTYSRQWKKVPYVFAINDRRTFGDYCGMYGVIMEKGVANEGTVTLADPKGRTQAVYELSRGGAVEFSHRDGKVEVPVRFATNDGRFFVFLPEEIADVRIETSGKVVRGGTVRVRASVLGKSGEPIPAVLPVEIVVADEATGRVFDGSGWHAAEDGVAELEMPLNRNEAVSGLLVTVRDRASGLVRKMQVR